MAKKLSIQILLKKPLTIYLK